MSFLAREYNIPFLGKVKLIEATDYDASINGKYYADNKKLGKGFIRKCNSLDELQSGVLERIMNYFTNSEIVLIRRKEKIEGKLDNLRTNLDDLIQNKNWLQNYQTDNPRQLDYQEKEKRRKGR